MPAVAGEGPKPGVENSVQFSDRSGKNSVNLSHHCWLSGSARAGSWSQESELGTESGHSAKGCQCFNRSNALTNTELFGENRRKNICTDNSNRDTI